MPRQKRAKPTKTDLEPSPSRRSARLLLTLAPSPSPFPIGSRIETRINLEGFRGSWFDAIVTDRVLKAGRVVKYKIQYVSLVKDDDPDRPEIDDVAVDDVRPEVPRQLKLTDGKENETEFELHELVEAYHNEGWWYGVISGVRNAETGKYRVSFPFSREVFDFSPSEIRPQLSFIKGNWVPLKPKPQKGGIYKPGVKVEAVAIREKYGMSWFPAVVEKIIHDNIFLIKYENINYLPKGHWTEILDSTALRPVTDRNPNSDKIEVNSPVEFFIQGGWANGVVTSVLSEGSYLIKVSDNDDVAPELIYEQFVRLRLMWDGNKWSNVKTLRKRGRPFGTGNSASSKKQKNDMSVSTGNKRIACKEQLGSETKDIRASSKKQKNDISISTSKKRTASKEQLGSEAKETAASPEKQKKDISISPSKRRTVCKKQLGSESENNMLQSEMKNDSDPAKKDEKVYSRVKRAVLKFPKSKLDSSSVNMRTRKDKSREATESINSPVKAGADISKGKIVNSQNGHLDRTSSSKPLSNDLISTPPNPNPNQVSIPPNPNPNQVSTLPNPNQVSTPPNPSESTSPSAISGNIILPFEWKSPMWKFLETLDIFKRIPQKPHFANLQRCCKKEELDGRALGQMVNYSNLADSIKSLSPEAELAEFHEKFDALNSLQQDGFQTDPLRTRLLTMIDLKNQICESLSKRKEIEKELSQKHGDNNEVLRNVDKIGAELAEVRGRILEGVERERRLKERRERFLEKSIGNGHRISRLKSEIAKLDRKDERVRERFLMALNEPLWVKFRV